MSCVWLARWELCWAAAAAPSAQLRMESQAQVRVTSPPEGAGTSADSAILVEGGHGQCMHAVRVVAFLLRNFQVCTKGRVR